MTHGSAAPTPRTAIGVVLPSAHDGADPDAITRLVAACEQAGVAAVVAPVPAAPRDAAGGLDPLVLLSALSVVTERIGLVATVAADDEPPYAIARKVAALDHLSSGRGGWSVVPVTEGDADHADDERARELVDVVRGLWDTVADDAFPRDQESGIFVDLRGRRRLDHQGAHFASAGPINVSRPPQGHPCLFLAASSADEVDRAAATADVVVVPAETAEEADGFRTLLDGALSRNGREHGDARLWCAVPARTAGETADLVAALAPRVDGVVLSLPDDATAAGALVADVVAAVRERGVALAEPAPTLRDVLGLRRPALTIVDMKANA